MALGRKKQEGTALLYLASGLLRNAANSSVVPTEFAAKPTTKMKSSKANFLTWTFRLPPKRQLSILLNFFVPFIDTWYFSQFLNFTSVKLNRFNLLNKLSYLKKSSFSKGTVVMRFPAKKNAGCPKAPHDFRPTPVGLSLDSPSPPPESERTYRRTLTSQSKFLGSIGYQICLAMVLCRRATRAGSAHSTQRYFYCNQMQLNGYIGRSEPLALPKMLTSHTKIKSGTILSSLHEKCLYKTRQKEIILCVDLAWADWPIPGFANYFNVRYFGKEKDFGKEFE